MGDDPGRLYRLDGVAHIAGVINDEVSGLRKRGLCICSNYAVYVLASLVVAYPALGGSRGCVLMRECPDRADEETVRRFARAYIMMLLGMQLFADKSGNRIHIRWLPYVAWLEEMAIISGSTSSSSGSSNKPSPTPAGVGQCTSVGICSPYRTSSPTLPLRSTANEGDATSCIGGSYTGAEDEATAGLELEPATAAIVLAFRFEPPELDTTSTNFANNSGVLTSENCLRQRNITCKSSSLPIICIL
ncbi:hypothetical protein Ahy_B03g068606 [Arachis hypogaea]|uniref:Aminotransferase-like plant mobile domain-containing protein n=1 Tax=Arachis hypogaea TaxID=3818 RepID=A0A445AAA3_ARAHY|nr:hypothetical protein Ahy_B03g068606 [Arachis hypogaea]